MNMLKLIKWLLLMFIITVLGLLAGCMTEHSLSEYKEKETTVSLQFLVKNLVIPDNASEVYTSEEATITQYLGCSENGLFFLGISPENQNTHESDVLILSAERSETGGLFKILVNLGPALYYDALAMIDGRIYLNINTSENNETLPAGGALISVETNGSVHILKENHYQIPLISLFGDRILYSVLPEPGGSTQIVETYDPGRNEWQEVLSLSLLRIATEETEYLLTGTSVYRFGGVSEEGFWFASRSYDSEPIEKEGISSTLWYYDALTGKSRRMGDLTEDIMAISGDESAVLFCTKENGWLVYCSQGNIVENSLLPARVFWQKVVRKAESDIWMLSSYAETGNGDAVALDLLKRELINYHTSAEGWQVQTSFMTEEASDTVICLMTEKSAVGSARQQVVVFPVLE